MVMEKILERASSITASRTPSDPAVPRGGPTILRLPSLRKSFDPRQNTSTKGVTRQSSKAGANKSLPSDDGNGLQRRGSKKILSSNETAADIPGADGNENAPLNILNSSAQVEAMTHEDFKPGARWGLLPNWEELDPKNPHLPVIRYANYGKGRERSANVVFLLTNAVRKEADDVFTLLNICQAKRFLLTHDAIADLYVWFSESVSIVSSIIDLIIEELLPAAEATRALDGQLAPDQRAVHLQWIKTAAETMRESQQKFTKRLPAGEQFPGLIHAAFGFTFSLDFVALVDRQVPKRLEELSRRRTRRFERSILMSMAGVKCSAEAKAPMDTLAVLTRWMNRDQRIIFHRRFFSPTDVLRRVRKNGMGTSYRQVQVMLKHLGDDDEEVESIAIRIDPRDYIQRKPAVPEDETDFDTGEEGAGDYLFDDDAEQIEGATSVWIIENVFNFEDELYCCTGEHA
jgi:hypothetical protein